MISESQRKGFLEILSHFYNTRFIQRLVDLKHKELLEQLDVMLNSGEREQYQDYIMVLADTFNQCVSKPLSSKHLDALFWYSLVPKEMHKQPPKPYDITFQTAVPFIHAEIYDLCSKNKVPTLKLFNEDYQLITESIERGIQKSQKGYFVPVDGIQGQLDEMIKVNRKLKSKMKAQKQYIETLEQQIKEYEKIQERQSSESSKHHFAQMSYNNSDEEQKEPPKSTKTRKTRTTKQTKDNTDKTDKTKNKSKKTDISYLNGQAGLPELQALDL